MEPCSIWVTYIPQPIIIIAYVTWYVRPCKGGWMGGGGGGEVSNSVFNKKFHAYSWFDKWNITLIRYSITNLALNSVWSGCHIPDSPCLFPVWFGYYIPDSSCLLPVWSGCHIPDSPCLLPVWSGCHIPDSSCLIYMYIHVYIYHTQKIFCSFYTLLVGFILILSCGIQNRAPQVLVIILC